jgi:hypothetical protein
MLYNVIALGVSGKRPVVSCSIYSGQRHQAHYNHNSLGYYPSHYTGLSMKSLAGGVPWESRLVKHFERHNQLTFVLLGSNAVDFPDLCAVSGRNYKDTDLPFRIYLPAANGTICGECVSKYVSLRSETTYGRESKSIKVSKAWQTCLKCSSIEDCPHARIE